MTFPGLLTITAERHALIQRTLSPIMAVSPIIAPRTMINKQIPFPIVAPGWDFDTGFLAARCENPSGPENNEKAQIWLVRRLYFSINTK